MKNLLNKIKQNPLRFFMIITLIYPVLPLALVAIWGSVVIVSGFFMSQVSTFSLPGALWMLLALFLFWGGPVGFLAGIYALRKKLSKKVFWLFLYGAVSYALVAIPFIIGTIMSLNVMNTLHVAYLSMTLIVITINILQIHRQVFNKKLSIEVS